MQGTYIVEIKARKGYNWNGGFYSYIYESNKKRALMEYETLIAEGRIARVKVYLTGKIIKERI